MQRPRFDSKSGHLGFMMNRVALEQVFSEYLIIIMIIITYPLIIYNCIVIN
jgi:hypothetical protein